ncbi:MAG: hypothetical protein GX862_07190 [Leucobacter sp.]|nr:hypothetical protein [Leucobacter sp.]
MSEQPHHPVEHVASGTSGDLHGNQRRPRTGPIVWGALILVFCAFVTQRTLAPGTVNATTWIIASMIGLGALLLIVGVAVIFRSRR